MPAIRRHDSGRHRRARQRRRDSGTPRLPEVTAPRPQRRPHRPCLPDLPACRRCPALHWRRRRCRRHPRTSGTAPRRHSDAQEQERRGPPTRGRYHGRRRRHLRRVRASRPDDAEPRRGPTQRSLRGGRADLTGQGQSSRLASLLAHGRNVANGRLTAAPNKPNQRQRTTSSTLRHCRCLVGPRHVRGEQRRRPRQRHNHRPLQTHPCPRTR